MRRMVVGEESEGGFAGTPRFEIIRRIGAGGMGVVYEAYDREQRAPVGAPERRAQITGDTVQKRNQRPQHRAVDVMGAAHREVVAGLLACGRRGIDGVVLENDGTDCRDLAHRRGNPGTGWRISDRTDDRGRHERRNNCWHKTYG